ncbi:MAG: hypothetical protein V8R64_00350 [Thomasclavelia sp.]
MYIPVQVAMHQKLLMELLRMVRRWFTRWLETGAHGEQWTWNFEQWMMVDLLE